MVGAGDTPRGGAGEADRRAVIHLDMDAFFAAVEVLDNPGLRGKPLIVGGTPEGRGVVATASYEARRYGVHSAMPAARAVKLCPRGIFLRPRLSRYAAVSRHVFRILREYSPLVEPLSIDEAFLDVSRGRGDAASELAAAEATAQEIRRRVRQETGGLTSSLGVARNKFLAKLGSDLAKPDGVLVVPEEGVLEFLAPLPIRRLWGVGPRTAERLAYLGLSRIGDLQKVPVPDLEKLLGRELGRRVARLSRGEDERQVEPRGDAKSVSQEETFGQFIPARRMEVIERELFSLSDRVARRLRRSGLWGRVVTIKVRDDLFTTRTRSRTLDSPTCLAEDVFDVARALLERVSLGGRSVRLLGVGVSGLTPEPYRQLDLFAEDDWQKRSEAARAADRVRDRLGESALRSGRLMREEGEG